MSELLFEMPPRVWERIDGRPDVTCAGEYLHTPSGWMVIHCGHPTANYPYYIITKSGRKIFAPSGRGFMQLASAKQVVEKLTKETKP